MEIIIIAAVDKNNVIGKDNKLPWHLPEDLAHFRKLTTGHTVLLGRKTFESIPNGLPNREVLTLSRNGNGTFNCVEDALYYARVSKCQKLFIAGGGEVYATAWHCADKIILTQIDLETENDWNGDFSYFPEIHKVNWTETKRESHVSKTGLKYDIVEFIRNEPGTRKRPKQN